jgi:predicted nucleotidyltransferase
MERIKEIDVEIFEFITLYKNMLLENCSNEIIGIYLFGSLAYGGFDEGRSDIDIEVITKTLLKGFELDTVKNIHKKLENKNQKWSKRFEASYTPIEMLKENNPPKDPRPYYGEMFYDEATYGNEWLINNYLLYNYGITIYGPEFKTLLHKPITINEIQQACIKDFYKE